MTPGAEVEKLRADVAALIGALAAAEKRTDEVVRHLNRLIEFAHLQNAMLEGIARHMAVTSEPGASQAPAAPQVH